MKVTGQFRTDGDLSLPKGIGFLVGNLSSTGAFIARGRLPDNRPFSASSRMKVDGSLEFDCSPYGKDRGRIHGRFVKRASGNASHRWDATLNWTRSARINEALPEAIDGRVTALLATYAPTPGSPAISGYHSIASGILTAYVDGDSPVSETLSWSPSDVVVFTPPNPKRVQLRVNRTTGTVSGSYRNSAQELRRISGVIFALVNGAVGLVSGGEVMGSFILYAN